MDSPAVSVIVPIYNAEKYLKECIDSIIAQTLSELEIILIDDGSSDSSGKICEEYAGKDARIRAVHQTNQGVSAARNLGVQLARGRYVGFVDADDWVAPEMFRMLYENAVQNRSQLILCDYFKVKNDRFTLRDELKGIKANDPQIKTKLIAGMLSPSESNIMGSCCRMLIRRDFLLQNDIRFEDNTRMAEDLLFVLRCVSKVGYISFEKTPLYYYRLHWGSVTQNYVEHFWENSMAPVEWVEKYRSDCSADPAIDAAIKADIASSVAAAAANACKNGTPMRFWERVGYCGQLEKLSAVRQAVRDTWKNRRAFKKTVWPQVVCIRLNLSWLVVLYHSVKNRTLFQ